MEAMILNVGVDTLKVNVKLRDQAQVLPVDLEVRCGLWQQQAREKSKPVATTITFHDERMTMLPNGAPAWKYIVKNDYLQIAMAARLHIPMIAKVTFASAYLWEMGNVHDALDEVRGLLVDLFGVHLILQGAQMMGHTTLTMTNHYASLTTQALKRAQERFSPLRAHDLNRRDTSGSGYWEEREHCSCKFRPHYYA